MSHWSAVRSQIGPARLARIRTRNPRGQLPLVTFQVIGRTPFDAEAYEDANGRRNGVPGGIDPNPFATGPMEPPDPSERGYKDTVEANPGYFTTIRAKPDLPTGATAPQDYV
jgi:hypothetical protein